MDRTMRFTGVYFLYDKNKELVYIGYSENLFSRIYTSAMSNNTKYFSCILFDCSVVASYYETYFIWKFKPRMNEYRKNHQKVFNHMPQITGFATKINHIKNRKYVLNQADIIKGKYIDRFVNLSKKILERQNSITT